MLKKFLSFALILCMLLSLLALTACNDEKKPEGDTTESTSSDDGVYTVTLQGSDGSPVEGATLMISDGKSIFKNVTTDADGKASVEVTGEGLGVMIVSLPTGYDKPTAIEGSTMHAMFGENKAITVTVNKTTEEKVVYTVKVIDQNGNAVVGATLQLCPNGTCLPDDFITDAKGEVTKELSPNLPVDIKVKELPTGYTKPTELDNGYHAKIEAGEVSVTVTVTKN